MTVEIMELPTPTRHNQLTFMYRQLGEERWNKYELSVMAIVLGDVPTGNLVRIAIENEYGRELDLVYVPYKGEL